VENEGAFREELDVKIQTIMTSQESPLRDRKLSTNSTKRHSYVNSVTSGVSELATRAALLIPSYSRKQSTSMIWPHFKISALSRSIRRPMGQKWSKFS
jgi:hypothetical protein